MEINFELLMRYLKETGSATIGLDIESDSKDPIISVQRGSYDEQSDTRIFLKVKDFYDILMINGILGDEGEVQKILKEPRDNKSNHLDIDKRVDDSIYMTLAKYLSQLVYASQGSIYPKINCLDIHSEYFHQT